MSTSLPSMHEDVQQRFSRIYNRQQVLHIDKVHKFFGKGAQRVCALHNINFTVHKREFICVIGPSGCGKSTLIRILAGLDQTTTGQVLLEGKAVRGPGKERGMVFQGYTLFPWLTVKKNIMFGPQIAGRGSVVSESEANEWIEMVGLTGFAGHYPNQLSGGMKQRVAIARALANHPRILLMDEPFGALDAQTRATMQAHLLAIWRNVNLTVFFITHDLDEAIYLADRIIVLGARPGRVVSVIENPLKRPRSIEQLSSAEFIQLKKHLQELIHPPKKIEVEPIQFPRMTQAGDDIW